MSPFDHDESRLPERVESLLADWPAPERDAAGWDDSAGAIQAHLGDVEPGSTPDALLATPLPAASDEGSLPAASGDDAPASVQSRPVAVSPPQSLADLARASMAESAKPDDDLSDIARDSLSLASKARGSAPDLAAALAPRPSRPSVPPAPSSAAGNDAGAEQPPHLAPALQPKRRGNGPLIAAGMVLFGLTAVLFIVVRGHHSPTPLATNMKVEPEPASAAPSAAPAKPTGNEVGVLSIDQLPHGELAAFRPAAPAATSPGIASGGKPAARRAQPGNETRARRNTPKPDKKKTAAPGHKPIPGARLAEGTAHGVPDKPSIGQVAVAVGAVLGSARACVAGQNEPSHAVLVFGSNGRVRSVSVSGPAAGTPAAGCIRTALSQARVQPFARSRFSVGTAVRPR